MDKVDMDSNLVIVEGTVDMDNILDKVDFDIAVYYYQLQTKKGHLQLLQ